MLLTVLHALQLAACCKYANADPAAAQSNVDEA